MPSHPFHDNRDNDEDNDNDNDEDDDVFRGEDEDGNARIGHALVTLRGEVGVTRTITAQELTSTFATTWNMDNAVPTVLVEGARDCRYVLGQDVRCAKLFVLGCRDTTVVVRCSLVTSTVEVTRCVRTEVALESPSGAQTVQADLCASVVVRFAHGCFSESCRVVHAGNDAITVRHGNDVTGVVSDYAFAHNARSSSAASRGGSVRGGFPPNETQFITKLGEGGRLATQSLTRDAGRWPSAPALHDIIHVPAPAAASDGSS